MLEFITYEAVLGNFLRGMHFFGASAMMLLVGIHMIQVFLMGCYKYPREFNWVDWRDAAVHHDRDGIHRAAAALGSDRGVVHGGRGRAMLARMPLIGRTVAHFLLGGKTLGGATLSRFFAFHVFFIPAIIFALVGPSSVPGDS